MTSNSQIVVLKFGSSVLRSEEDLPTAVHEIYQWWRDGVHVVAVVSALGDTTDRLLRLADNVCDQPDKSALATLLATGEAAASALLGLALNKAGIPAQVLDAAQAGLRTDGTGLDADPVALDAARICAEAQRGIVVLPGFVGRGEHGETTLLGRGGSDYTALFLAQQLKSRCVLLKDVDGLYTSDPAQTETRASRFKQVGYETAMRVGGSVVQQKAVRFAAANRQTFTITCVGSTSTTEVGPFTDRLDSSECDSGPLRVALVGCGIVGGGVYHRLAATPELFDCIAVVTKTGQQARALGVPDQLITTDVAELLKRECDVIVELTGTTTEASALANAALRQGRHFVTANKALLATEGDQLAALAEENGVTLRYSAAVGGALPALETIDRARDIGKIRSFSGILNGTTNFILDRIAEGEDLLTAVAAAQQAGYAEANPLLDLNGTDITHKLILLARKAFDVKLRFDEVDRMGIENIDPVWVQKARHRGYVVRLVAECLATPSGIKTTVKPIEIPESHPFAQVRGAGNCLVVQPASGDSLVVFAEGAGRWPTTESVIADLLDIRTECKQQELEVAVA